MGDQPKRTRRRFSDQFKRDAANLILVEGYTVSAAARAVGVDNKTLRGWHDRVAPEISSCGENASVVQFEDEVKRLRK
jgi:transposase